ncbi:MAG: phospholipase D-like domain-containing protein, partial [Betaproteobacteria bacterium]
MTFLTTPGGAQRGAASFAQLRSRLPWLARRLAIVPLITACASLPDYDALKPADFSPIRIVSAQGQLPPAKSSAVLQRLEERGGQSDVIRQYVVFMEAEGGPPLVLGNHARLLVDGPAAYAAMFGAIQAAKNHIHLETYILQDDVIGRKLADLLIRKREQGVTVRVLYDSVGSHETSKAFFENLASHGVIVHEFNPINPAEGRNWSINNRDHRKVLIVDGMVAYTGGINISSVYSSGSARRKKDKPPTEEGWRDTQIEIRGPAVAEFQKLFLDSWQRQHGPEITGGNYFPALKPQGDKIIRVIGSTPSAERNLMYLSLLSALKHADISIHITMAYFVPDPQTLAALAAAARRGVDVKLILPGVSDFWAVLEAGRSHYSELLAAGVKIYERQDALLHA